ncbi:Thiamine-phosphate synthase [Porphyridium purpureum]|uniref:thiamine phosphate synthase n=1 Tax=Porphyridium purpureum TaxID=35688 RepID=A0A5J4Z2I1_PORPP|nr:Thiamine-phosphate synthase [Porphyridium purpureum]|eukprot:POR7953..scf295_1
MLGFQTCALAARRQRPRLSSSSVCRFVSAPERPPRVEPSELAVYLVTNGLADSSGALNERAFLAVEQALQGGVSIVQLREKNMCARDLVRTGRRLKRLVHAYRAKLLVNDRVDVALAIDADGVHVGQDDLSAADVRRLIGLDRVLGVSAGTVEEAVQASRDSADYVGVGSVFGTTSKSDAGDPIGVAGLEQIIDSCRLLRLPVVAIGGISSANAEACIQAGASGVAVISAIMDAEDPEAAARSLARLYIGRFAE